LERKLFRSLLRMIYSSKSLHTTSIRWHDCCVLHSCLNSFTECNYTYVCLVCISTVISFHFIKFDHNACLFDTLAKWWKATINLFMSVCLSVCPLRMQQRGRVFEKRYIVKFYWNLSRK
jgi:hypothetical protein